MARPIWVVNLLKHFFPDRFRIAKWSRNPLIRSVIDRMLFEGDNSVFLPKDHTIKINATIEQPIDTILPSHVVTHFIEQASHHWVMDFCICREGEGCQDYDPKLGCLFLGEAVLKINPKLGRLVSKEEALAHVERCRQAGLVHMIGRNKIDTVWLGVNPGDKLLTICHCCPCCCLWKVVTVIHPSIGDKLTKMPGIRVSVSDHCTGCGQCANGICFVDAIQLHNAQAKISESCRGCGRCVEVCPAEAIEICIEDPAFLTRTVEQLTSVVDVS